MIEKYPAKRGDATIIQIYGAPLGAPEAVVFPDEAKILRPLENPDLALLRVDKEAGDNPLQLATVRFFTRAVSFGALATAAALTALLIFQLLIILQYQLDEAYGIAN